MSATIQTYPDAEALVAAAGDRLVDAMIGTIAARGKAMIVLTGGGTGIAMLRRVGRHADRIDWSRVHLFWGDERYVPTDDDERNEKQATEALIDRIDIPPGNVHPMPASDGEFGDDIDAAALAYGHLLAANAGPGEPAEYRHMRGTCRAHRSVAGVVARRTAARSLPGGVAGVHE